MTQIPIYRAEVEGIGKMAKYQAKLSTKIGERYYVIGFYSFLDNEHGITDLNGYYWKVKEKTRSISFENMLDKNKKRIFASLSEDGVGGDIVSWKTSLHFGESRVCFYNGGVRLRDYFLDDNLLNMDFANKLCEAIGIYKDNK